MHNNRAGFTLIELLISITIIGVLMTAAVVSYQAIQIKTRDGKRQADLKYIQGALQQYYADKGYFPTALSALTAPTTYMKSLPLDPNNPTRVYAYTASPGTCDNTPSKLCTSYCLYANLETTPQPASDLGCTPTLPSNYGLAPP